MAPAAQFVFIFIFYFFMPTNLCNAPAIQDNSYTIANINPETVDTIQTKKKPTKNQQKKNNQRQ